MGVTNLALSNNGFKAVFTISLNGDITKVSPSVERLTGYVEKELIGNHISKILSIKLNMMDMLERYGRADDMIQERFTMKHKEGWTLSIDAEIIPPAFTSSPDEVVFVIYKNDARARSSKESLNLENIYLQHEKLKAVGHLAAGIAHDIKNPLTAVKGFVDLLLNGNSVNQQTYLTIMKDEIRQIELITKELMTLAKPEEAKRTEAKLPVDLSAVLESIIRLLGTEAYRHRVELTLEGNAKEVKVYGYETQLRQLLLNISKNGIESMHGKGGELKIEVETVEQAVFIHISDNGCGMTEKELKVLGDPFYSTKESGNGLGLMMCYNIVKEHNGEITVHSRKNEGTIFSILLPFGA